MNKITKTIGTLEKLLVKKEVAAHYAVTTRTIEVWIKRGNFPAPIYIFSGVPRWDPAVIAAWDAAKTTQISPT